MSPLNRRGFLARLAAIPLAAVAVAKAAPTLLRHRFVFNTKSSDLDRAEFDWRDVYGVEHSYTMTRKQYEAMLADMNADLFSGTGVGTPKGFMS